MKRYLSVVILATMIAGSFAIRMPVASALNGDENCFLRLLNGARADAGRRRLALAGDLVSIARRHSRWMAQDGTIYHADSHSPHYRQGDNLRAELRGNWYAGGENVGMGPDCRSIHDAFMSSPGHRENILDRAYNQVGVGVAYDKDHTVYVTEDFVGRHTSRRVRVVVHRRAPVRPASHPRPARRPAPRIEAAPRTTGMLLLLIGLDAERVDPASGEALGI